MAALETSGAPTSGRGQGETVSAIWIVLITGFPTFTVGFLLGMQFGRAVQFANDLEIVRGGNERADKAKADRIGN